MNNYQGIHTKKTNDIENKRAFLIGSGIASLAAAEYLMRDGHMQGHQITIIEQAGVEGGALDGTGDAQNGYVVRGGREMEAHYECLWDLYREIPSLEEEGRSVLDEIKEINDRDPNYSKTRIIYNRGERHRRTDLGLKDEHTDALTKLLLTKEEDLGLLSVEEYFEKSYFETDMWLYWRSMFAFEPWHSVAEMRRYMARFIHLLPGMSTMRDLVFTKYNQYDSLVLPLKKKLLADGVKFIYNTTVTDIEITKDEEKKTVTALHFVTNTKEEVLKTDKDDLIFFTNGSMVENSTMGDMKNAPRLDTKEGAAWSLWKKVAKKDSLFGNPEVFCNNIDKTKWESFTITAKGEQFRTLMETLADRKFKPNKTATGGIITIKDSSWLMSVTVNRQPQFKNQPQDITI